MIELYKKKYYEAIIDTDKELALSAVNQCLETGASPETIMFKLLVPAMEELAENVRVGPDATLAQLYLASQTSSEVIDLLIPLFETPPIFQGKIVIGTAFEDFHGLGKKIVSGCLRAEMIEVIDLGLNVPAERFVNEALSHKAQVIAVSSMMVHTCRGENGPIKIRQFLKQENLENQIKLVVGGAPYRFHPSLYKEVGADSWADNGMNAAKVIIRQMGEVGNR